MDQTILEDKQEAAETKEPKSRAGWFEGLDAARMTRIVYLIFGLLATALTMQFLQFRTDAICCGDWDGYYHIRWASLLWENFSQGKWLPRFEWLPLTVLSPEKYADHHFLFHLAQIPFLWFFEPVTAAKVAAVFFSTAAVFSVYWLLYRYGVDYLLVWFAAILCCGDMFYYRMSMAKAPPLTIIFTIAGIYFLFERKYKWLFPLMFAFVWTYSLFPLLLIAAIIWTIIIGWNERKLEWQPVVYCAAGMVAGNIINPYFPNNIYLFIEHAITKIRVSDFAVSVGGEWYPFYASELLTHLPIAMLAMLLGYIFFMPRDGKLPERATFFLLFVSILFAAQFRSKRFAEYFPPFAILFFAFSLQAFRLPKTAKLPEEFQREIEPYLDIEGARKAKRNKLLKDAAATVIGILLAGLFIFNVKGFHKWGIEKSGLAEQIESNEPDDRYRRAMLWATGLDENGKENIPKGERIFNANWDDFPKLFFLDTSHSYVYGLDPNYLYSANPELFRILKDITDGRREDAGQLIRERFGANWVFVDARENDEMVAKLLGSGWAEIAYEDDEAQILKIRIEKGEPPKDVLDQEPETPEEKQQLDEMEKNDNLNLDTEEGNEPASEQ
jgi:hypothetical protein